MLQTLKNSRVQLKLIVDYSKIELRKVCLKTKIMLIKPKGINHGYRH